MAEPFQLGAFSIDDYRPLRIVVVGAGYSGIMAGIRFIQKIPNLTISIYEKNAGVGGTWWSNNYPGAACDAPAHTYQYSFSPKSDWTSFYAPAAEIRGYLEEVAEKYKLAPYLKLSHQVKSATWDNETAKWNLRIQQPSGEIFEDSADFLFTGTGVLSQWKWPDVEGIDQFKGKLYHSSHFRPEDAKEWKNEWKDKKVAVLGVGSSAVQIVPALQPRVAKLYNFVRGKAWFAPPFNLQKIGELIQRNPAETGFLLTAEDQKKLEDPAFYKKFRREVESDLNSLHFASITDSPMQALGRQMFSGLMNAKLQNKPWIAEYLIPDFPVMCRRVSPDNGYLDALCADNVEFVPSPVKRLTATGLETEDGKTAEVDIVICATGFDTSSYNAFPIIGKDGVELREKWGAEQETYLTVCVDGFPNYFMSSGPNSFIGAGALIAMFERQVLYAVQAAQKLQRERLRTIEVKPEAVKDFEEYMAHYFPTSVYSGSCRSWYKADTVDGKVSGVYPGSTLHAVRALSNPRWEDFTYERIDKNSNRLYWLGDGSTYNEKHMLEDKAWYLDDREVDIPPVPSA